MILRNTSLIRERLLLRQRALRAVLRGELEQLGDDDDESYGDEILIEMSSHASDELVQVDEALQRLRAGEYGMCTDCQRDIGETRLQALPYVLTCIVCQLADDKTRPTHNVNHSNSTGRCP